MSKLVVTGGKQRKRTLGVKEWSQYEHGTIIVLDTDDGKILQRHDYTSPAEFMPDQKNSSVLFKSSSVVGSRLYACTQTEVIIYSLPEFEQLAHISLACFNDVHHVVPTVRNTLLVVSTGLDLIVEIDMQGGVLREWFTVESSNWSRFDRSTDYRKVLSTKPHQSHPNFVFQNNDDIWVTRFEQKDALCLTRRGSIDIGVERPHDGHVMDGHVYFTTVNGHIVEASLESNTVTRDNSLLTYYGEGRLIGWCRGLCPIDRNNFIVGFSRIRASKIHANLIWARKILEKNNETETLPTRVVNVDLENNRIKWEFDLEPHGLNAIFSIQIL